MLFIFRFPLVEGDSLIYGDIAKNWLQHGVYGVGSGTELHPTLIRLPGYPVFLAGCFALFGMEHYRAVMLAQTALDMGTAWLMGEIALLLFASGPLPRSQTVIPIAKKAVFQSEQQRRGALTHRWPVRAACCAFALYCVFPYTANYVSQPLAEGPTLFAMALAFYYGLRAFASKSLFQWAGCGIATAATVMLRPDGGLLLITLLLFLGARRHWRAVPILLLCVAAAVAPWMLRNHRAFGVWQPLVPNNATDPGDFYPQGFSDWQKTWIVEFCSVYEFWWNVPGETVDPSLLPSRAFDSERQKERTLTLLAHYNEKQEVDAALDHEFALLAQERRRAHPLMDYVGLPIAREMDMWLRPRTDTFPIEVRWWEYWRVPNETTFAAVYAALGVIALVLAGVGGWSARFLPFAGMLGLYVLLRIVFLLTVDTPEPRYTIECFPIVLVFAAIALAKPHNRKLT
ncbi:MAG: glycosyltransferase family 39 protein [Acidobacteriales bacterium]|nr:glycosyltransferase family 39 protein [Terriglobales bacterium]